MAKQEKSKFINFITWLLLLLLLIGGIGAVLHFAGIGKDDITDIVNPTFRVEYDGNVYKTDTENVLAVPQSGQARFEVKNGGNFSVAIVPNVTAETDFTYTVNGQSYLFSEVKDLPLAFDLKVFDGAFTVNFDNVYSVKNLLSKIWGTDNITVDSRTASALYKISVVSSKGETIDIALFTGVQKIELPESIIF